MRKLVWFITGIWILAVLAAGCSRPAPSQPAPQIPPVKKLTVGMLKLTSSAPLFIGIEKGFFREQGLEIDVKWFEAAHPIAVATASNQVDVGGTGITASLLNMVAGGQNLSIVADKGREEKGYSSSALLVTTDLWNQGVRSIDKLKGKKIGITQTGSTFHYMIGRLLESKGLTLADVELVPLGKLGTLMAALQSKQIDAVIVNEPNITKVLKDGYGKLVAQVGDVIEYQTSGLFFSPGLMQDKETAIRFMKAYIKANRYYYDAALVKKDGKPAPGVNFEEVVTIIAAYTGAPVEDVKLGLPYIDRDGRLLSEDIGRQIEWYTKNKMVEKPLDPKSVYDTSLVDAALQQLK
ncbi:ABC transporter substrate-binding protein [Acetonema longum]|uniref:NMT1/THI5 like domain protein n=1 Tax=Acetonema longum DSM 6540 TaxID=1009370 RepID=F7NI23_9FIRM|nr:ABC transporter substrate-binding protein [Acetonema longum]EGO64330.1 NMT1/THI5 like domain protein [Acetonema longum DSM 6540]